MRPINRIRKLLVRDPVEGSFYRSQRQVLAFKKVRRISKRHVLRAVVRRPWVPSRHPRATDPGRARPGATLVEKERKSSAPIRYGWQGLSGIHGHQEVALPERSTAMPDNA